MQTGDAEPGEVGCTNECSSPLQEQWPSEDLWGQDTVGDSA